MRKYGAFEVEKHGYKKHETLLSQTQMQNATIDPETQVIQKEGKKIGVMLNGKPYTGFPTPSRKNEFYSQTMVGLEMARTCPSNLY